MRATVAAVPPGPKATKELDGHLGARVVGGPSGDTSTFPVFAVLGLVLALMSWAFVRSLRPEGRARAVSFTTTPPAAPGAT